MVYTTQTAPPIHSVLIQLYTKQKKNGIPFKKILHYYVMHYPRELSPQETEGVILKFLQIFTPSVTP